MAQGDKDSKEPVKLLLVDDEKSYVEVLAKRMAKRNIIVTPALGGTEAIQVLRRQNFDVVVLDLKMEDMDGIEVLRILKIMDPGLPVIMLTGHGSETAAREGLELGAFDYLTKPCDLSELIAKIEEARRRGGVGIE